MSKSTPNSTLCAACMRSSGDAADPLSATCPCRGAQDRGATSLTMGVNQLAHEQSSQSALELDPALAPAPPNSFQHRRSDAAPTLAAAPAPPHSFQHRALEPPSTDPLATMEYLSNLASRERIDRLSGARGPRPARPVILSTSSIGHPAAAADAARSLPAGSRGFYLSRTGGRFIPSLATSAEVPGAAATTRRRPSAVVTAATTQSEENELDEEGGLAEKEDAGNEGDDEGEGGGEKKESVFKWEEPEDAKK